MGAGEPLKPSRTAGKLAFLMFRDITGFGAASRSSGQICTVVTSILSIFEPKAPNVADQKINKSVVTTVLEVSPPPRSVACVVARFKNNRMSEKFLDKNKSNNTNEQQYQPNNQQLMGCGDGLVALRTTQWGMF